MRTYTNKRPDGSIVVTKFDKNKSYSKEYSSIHEYNKSVSSGAISLGKILFAPIYYPVKFVFKILFLLIKGIYWDLSRFIYFKIKK